MYKLTNGEYQSILISFLYQIYLIILLQIFWEMGIQQITWNELKLVQKGQAGCDEREHDRYYWKSFSWFPTSLFLWIIINVNKFTFALFSHPFIFSSSISPFLSYSSFQFSKAFQNFFFFFFFGIQTMGLLMLVEASLDAKLK